MTRMQTLDDDQIRPGSRVTMHYTVRLEDGMVADTSREGEPLTFTLGDGSVVPGLELALYGLRAGDTQTLAIAPQDAFGFRDPDNVHTLPRSEFPADMELEEGLIVEFATPSGETTPGAVRRVGKDEVEVDFNHPLAGHEITFEVEILSVAPPAADGEG